jgi:hypothetical protein
MALIPSSSYSGQVSTSDPAYPLGKAQNEAVAGDGTGTPLERDWINDVWGFLQAILDAGAVTASGTPDKVGASQYLAALQAGLHVWTGLNDFTQTVILNNASCAAVLAGTASEFLYADVVGAPAPRTRHSWVNLPSGMLDAPGTTSLAYAPGSGEMINYGSLSTVSWLLDLPDGAIVTSVEVMTLSNSLATTKLVAGVRSVTYNAAPGDPTMGTETTATASTNIQTLTLSGPWTIANATSRLQVRITAANLAVPTTTFYAQVYGIRVNWSDLGPRSF